MSKLIQKYQVSEEDLLCDFSKVELMVFQVTSWTVIHSASFKSCQDISNEVKRKGLVHKKKNLMLSIFGHFDLMMWWESKAISGSTVSLFEGETDHYKIPQVLLIKLAQLNIKFENDMRGTPKKMEKMTPTDY